jgi:hypothetical protein
MPTPVGVFAFINSGIRMENRTARRQHRAQPRQGPESTRKHFHFVFLISLAGILFSSTASRAQISPGALSKAHTSLSGPAQCGQCHGIGIGTAKLKCLDCHTDIRERIAQGRGMHAQWVVKNSTGKACISCHSEHNGVDFDLIHWEPSLKDFDHSKTGYALEGGHARLECKQCHTTDHIPTAERLSIVVKDLNRTFLGLSRDCLTCHVDEHRGQLSKDCLTCHTFTDWKTAPKFNHAKAKYPLTGAHERVACQKCHIQVAGPKPYEKYVGIPFSACVSCHTDPHKGAFPNTCQTCHNTASWKQVRMEGNFDHSKTKFPLLGKHEAVGCEKCHVRGDFKAPVAFAKCADCHAPDPHRGQFSKRAAGGECAECHNVNGWKPSLFTVAMHADTKYPLAGKHSSVACEKCHISKGADTVYKISQTNCAACHTDVHKGQFAGPPHKNRCEDCHTVQTFHSVRFTPAAHDKTRFPLTGAHPAVPCVECHKPDLTVFPAGPVKYRFEDRTCTGCHTDPHKGQFAERMARRRANGSPFGCEACHNLSNWKEMVGFDHSTTSFPLVGAHRAVHCSGCHLPANLRTTLRDVDFKAAPKQCNGCHEDAHGRQFSKGAQSPDCATCHNNLKWRPSLFDHEKRSTFSLKGAHQQVPCEQCHKLFRDVEGKQVLFYKPTPRECKACHDSL